MKRLAGLTAALVVALPGSALGAQQELLASRAPLAVPALSAERVLVSAQPAPGAIDLLSVPFGGEPTRLLALRAHPRDPALLAYAASGSRVVVARGLTESGAREVFTGPAAGPLTLRQSCDAVSAALPAGGGSVLAWGGGGCVADRLRIDWGDGSADVDPPGYVTGLAAGGRFAAWLALDPSTDPVRIRVFLYDTAARAIVRDEQVPPSSDLDVQEDGSVVLATYAPGDGAPPRHCGRTPLVPRFLLLAPGAPVRELPLRTCSARVRVAGGRIAFVERTGSGADVLSLADLSGENVQPVAAPESFPPHPRFDWDGRRVAWATTRCRDHALLVRDPADGDAAPAGGRCPIRIGSPRLGRDGRLRVRIACPEGCVSDPGLTVISPRWLQFRSRGRPMPWARFDLRPGGRATLRLPLTRHQQALVRRGGRVEVRLRAIGLNLYEPRVRRILRAR